jgi:hypothetical protein
VAAPLLLPPSPSVSLLLRRSVSKNTIVTNRTLINLLPGYALLQAINESSVSLVTFSYKQSIYQPSPWLRPPTSNQLVPSPWLRTPTSNQFINRLPGYALIRAINLSTVSLVTPSYKQLIYQPSPWLCPPTSNQLVNRLPGYALLQAIN